MRWYINAPILSNKCQNFIQIMTSQLGESRKDRNQKRNKKSRREKKILEKDQLIKMLKDSKTSS